MVSKSYHDGSYHIVGFDGQKLINISLPNDNMNCVTPGFYYKFELVNFLNATGTAAYTVAVQGQPIQLGTIPPEMFSALMNFASTAVFSDMFSCIPGETYIHVENEPQKPQALIVRGDMIKKLIMPDNTTRCVIISGGLQYDMRYTGTHFDSYDTLPLNFMPNLSVYRYTLILIVADPFTGTYCTWPVPRNYILVAAVYRN